jgi:hypothetical protein
MSDVTCLKPLPTDRLRLVGECLRQSSADEAAGLALDDQGFVVSVVRAEETDATHVLGDLDVHA